MLPLLLVLSIGLVACGGDSGASDEEVAQIEKEAIKRERQKQRLDSLEDRLKDLKKDQDRPRPDSTVPNPPPGTTPAPTESNCGTISINSVTSCGFAENVRAAYEAEIGSGSGYVEAFSPAKGIYYDMYCTGGSPHECTGGVGAWLSFP